MTPLPFSRTFILTLAGSPRTDATLDHLRVEGIAAEPFEGFDGRLTGLVTTHTYELDHPGTDYRIGPKTVNMFLGHLAMWRVCEYLDGDSFLFLEDDVRFNPGWRSALADGLAALPPSWDLLYLGSCCCRGSGRSLRPITERLYEVDYALCTHAYAVRKSALPVLRRACTKIYAGIDIAMCLHGIPKLKTYAFLPRLADQFETQIAP